jgi:bacterioferritin
MIMKGDADVITLLNEVLTAELTVINQYYVHYKMCENWGYKALAKNKRGESIEEMEHADKVIERILFLDGIPNMQRMFQVKVGTDPIEQHKFDLEAEFSQRERLNKGIALCVDRGDNGTRELLERIVKDEEESIDWLEAQLFLVDQVGKELYLAEQIHEGSE